MSQTEDKETSRRGFFQQALRRVLEPVVDYVDEHQQSLRAELSAEANQKDHAHSPWPLSYYLRPPGALPESQFIDTCERSGNCIVVCPAQAIFALDQGENSDPLPYLDPDQQPCVVCDSLACMEACPSGALQKTAREEIEIGVAVVNTGLCLNSEGIECRICIDLCPLGESAIQFEAEAQEVVVIEEGCIGCGVCQHHCPTYPKSIFVRQHFENMMD